nr:MAG TPA: tail protein [Caudoviricetes sp.]
MVRQISFKYELLNINNTHKKWLKTVKSCDIQWQSLTQLKSSAKISMRKDDDVDYMNDRVRIYRVENGVEQILGTFLLCSSNDDENGYNVTNKDCECYSLLKILLDDKLEQTYQVVAGTNVVNEVIRLIGISNAYNIPLSNKVLLTAKTYKAGTTYLDVINDLLDTINYTALYTDKMGVYVSKPYVLPQDREIEFTWKCDINGLIRPDKNRSLDAFNIPNVFAVSTNDININPPLTHTYVNDNPSSPTSTVSRGRRIVQTATVDTTSIDDLVVKAKAMCVEANSVYEHIEFDKAFVGNLEFYMDCGFIIDSKYIIYNISYKCAIGEDMHIKARKAVELLG